MWTSSSTNLGDPGMSKRHVETGGTRPQTCNLILAPMIARTISAIYYAVPRLTLVFRP
jgi:hypothetical protein